MRQQGKSKPYTVIVGCGRLGANLANTLSDYEEDVLIIDRSKEVFRKLSPSFGGLTLFGDATDLDILAEAQLDKADAIVIVTNNDNINIMVAQLAKELYNVPKVIARLYNPDCDCVYREFHIDTICPTVLSANAISALFNGDKKEEVS